MSGLIGAKMGMRRKARVIALQALFEVDSVGHDAEETVDRLVAEVTLPEEVSDFARELVGGVLMVASGLLLLAGYYWFATGRVDLLGTMLVMLGMALPPLITGSLILLLEKRKPA